LAKLKSGGKKTETVKEKEKPPENPFVAVAPVIAKTFEKIKKKDGQKNINTEAPENPFGKGGSDD